MFRLDLSSSFIQPTGHMRETNVVRRIVDEKNADRVTIVGTGDTSTKATVSQQQ